MLYNTPYAMRDILRYAKGYMLGTTLNAIDYIAMLNAMSDICDMCDVLYAIAYMLPSCATMF